MRKFSQLEIILVTGDNPQNKRIFLQKEKILTAGGNSHNRRKS